MSLDSDDINTRIFPKGFEPQLMSRQKFDQYSFVERICLRMCQGVSYGIIGVCFSYWRVKCIFQHVSTTVKHQLDNLE